MSVHDIYTYHHAHNRNKDFSILKKERGDFLRGTIGEGKRVLDLGCRNGVLTSQVLKGNSVMGVDVDPIALKEAHDRFGIETHLMDLHGDWSELEGELFDAIICGEVLEHLYFPEQVVEKAARHLTKKGLFVGSVPNAFSIKNRIRFLLGDKHNTPLSDPTHINQFHIEELHAILARHFSHVEIHGLGSYPRLATLSPNFFAFDLLFSARV